MVHQGPSTSVYSRMAVSCLGPSYRTGILTRLGKLVQAGALLEVQSDNEHEG